MFARWVQRSGTYQVGWFGRTLTRVRMETHCRVSRVQAGAGREREGTSSWWSQSPQEQETGPSAWMGIKGIEIRHLS